MKKVIFGTALASMALLSACSSDNELANVGTTANNAIGFHVVGNKAETRATPITPDNLTTTDFNVFAYKNNNGADGDIFMGDKENENGLYGVNIKYKNNKWDYNDPTELRYWPTTALNFYAVNPGSTNFFSWNFTNETKQITYTCSNEYAKDNEGNYSYPKNVEVMYAVAKNQTYSAANGGKVKFQFKHILSQVAFKAKTQYANMEVEIKEITIHNFRIGGTFTISSDTPAQTDWTRNAFNQKSGFTVVTDKNIQVTKADVATSISTETPMLFVPQKLKKWDLTGNTDAANNAEQSYLKITCKIMQSGAYLFGAETKVENLTDEEGYRTLYVPFEADWQPGMRYIYTLIFGGGYDKDGHTILKPINFEAETTKWVDDINNNNNGNDINIDK